MAVSATLSEDDFALLAALQRHPRASWTKLSPSLSVSPSALSRRWSRLQQRGIAWTTAHPGPSYVEWGVFALVTVQCDQSWVIQVATQLQRDPEALSVELTSGAGDIEITVATSTWDAFSDYLVHRIPKIRGVRSAESSLATCIHREGSAWLLDSPGSAKTRTSHSHGVLRSTATDDTSLSLYRLLGENARMTVEELSARIGAGPVTVRRRLTESRNHHLMALRCDVAYSHTGWPIQVRLRGDASGIGTSGMSSGPHLREVRLAMSSTGIYNFIVTLSPRKIGDLPEIEDRMRAQWPWFSVRERSVTLRTLKRVGNILDSDGKRVEHVPLAAWGPITRQPEKP